MWQTIRTQEVAATFFSKGMRVGNTIYVSSQVASVLVSTIDQCEQGFIAPTSAAQIGFYLDQRLYESLRRL